MIVITSHAREKMRERGILDSEVAETMEAGERVSTRGPRQVNRRVFTSGYERLGHTYPHKELTVVYVTEDDVTTVLTAIARYGRWEEADENYI